MSRIFTFALISALLVVVNGCANLSEAELRQRRIDDNFAFFAALETKVQERVRAGEVKEGDDASIVNLTLGKPKSTYHNEGDGTDTWRYFRIEEHPRTLVISEPPLNERIVDVDPTSYTNVQIVKTEVLSHKITLKDGKVVKAESF